VGACNYLGSLDGIFVVVLPQEPREVQQLPLLLVFLQSDLTIIEINLKYFFYKRQGRSLQLAKIKKVFRSGERKLVETALITFVATIKLK